jgi:hypothetical protein
MPSGLLAMEIQSDVWRVALAIRRANKRLNWIYLLQLSTSQLDLSFFEFRDAYYSHRRRDYLRFKSRGIAEYCASGGANRLTALSHPNFAMDLWL